MFPKSQVVEMVDHLAYNIASQSTAPTRDADQLKHAVSDWMNKEYYYKNTQMNSINCKINRI